MRKIVSLALLLPFIPNASEAIVNSHTILAGLAVHAELILVITPPLDDVPGQVWNHAEFNEGHIHSLRDVDDVASVCVQIVDQSQPVRI